MAAIARIRWSSMLGIAISLGGGLNGELRREIGTEGMHRWIVALLETASWIQ